MKDKKQIRFLVFIIIIIGIVMAFAAIRILPALISFSIEEYKEIAYLAKPVAIIVLISAIPFFIVLYETLMLSKYIISDEIFSDKPLRSLNIISISSLSIGILYLVVIFMFFKNKFLTPVLLLLLCLIILASVIIAIFSKIFSILVKRATILKVDNDLTI